MYLPAKSCPIKAAFKSSGGFLSGVVAVPVYPPSPLNLKGDMFKLDHIARDSGSKAALTTGLYKNVVRISKLRGVKWPVKKWFTTDDVKVSRQCFISCSIGAWPLTFASHVI
jgi:hypothetical protein